MIRQYLNQKKHKMFPNMDFTSEQRELKNKPVKKKTMMEFVWFSPSGFTLIYYGNPLLTAAIFFIIGLIFAFKSIWIATVIFFIVGVVMIRDFLIKLKDRNTMRGMTMYDWYLKEEILGIVK